MRVIIILVAIMAEQAAPQDFSVFATSSTCVGLSWIPVQGTQYEVHNRDDDFYVWNSNKKFGEAPWRSYMELMQCTGYAGWYDVPESRHVCNFEPFTVVECRLRASYINGTIEEAVATTTTSCGVPEGPDFVATFNKEKTNNQEKIFLDIQWQPSVSFCKSISHYNLTISNDSGLIFHKQYDVSDQRQEHITGISPATLYMVKMVAVNNQGNQSVESVTSLTSLEIPPGSGPGMTVNLGPRYSTYVKLTPPDEPNGKITKDEFVCDYVTPASEKPCLIKEVSPEDIGSAIYLSCNWGYVSKVKCAAVAYNSAGGSAPTTVVGFTDVYVVVRRPEWSHVYCSSYTPVNYSHAISNNLPCYIAAEVSPVAYRTMIELGDGSYYGDYYNPPLDIGKTYTIYKAANLLYQGKEQLIKYVGNEDIYVENFICPSPPGVNHSIIVGDTGRNISSTLTYECKKGFNIKGNIRLECQWNGTRSKWFGKPPRCQPVWAVGVGVGVPMSIITIVLLIVGGVCLRKRRMRMKEDTHVQELFGAAHPQPTQQPRTLSTDTPTQDSNLLEVTLRTSAASACAEREAPSDASEPKLAAPKLVPSAPLEQPPEASPAVTKKKGKVAEVPGRRAFLPPSYDEAVRTAAPETSDNRPHTTTGWTETLDF